ncbi:MAG: RNA polymerase sigma factor [Porcipelethomonas sp.]
MDNGTSSYCRFLEGDDNGIVEIIRDYKDGLILYINSIVCDISIAEELTEDTFVKIAVKKPKYKSKHSFKAWLYTIGRNSAMDYFRHSARKPEFLVEEYDKIADEHNIESQYLRDEQKILLNKALKTLNKDYQQVLYLSFFEDMSNADIGAVMHKSLRQIENLLYNAKKALKSQLEKDGFQYEEL